MAESGQVISQDGNEVTVRMERTEACAKCRACIAGFSKQEMIIKATNLCNAKEGDTVNIELEESSFLKAVVIMYGVPFAALVIGFALGYIITVKSGADLNAEIAAFITGIILMLAAFMLIKKTESRRNKAKYTPVATEIVK